MDKVAAYAVAASIPIIAAAFYGLTRMIPPLLGYAVALGFYWFCVLVPLILWRGGLKRANFRVLRPNRPLIILNAVMILALAGAAGTALWEQPVPVWILGAVITGALINGTLEEVFWRGTLLHDDASQTAQLGQLGLFTAWHVALLFATGVIVTGGAVALLGGAAFAGALWTLARMQTGSIGFGILCHIGVNIFAFSELMARNLV